MTLRGHKPGTTLTRESRGSVAVVEDVISSFFESLNGPHPAVPKTISGNLRFDLQDGNRVEHWRVTFAKGVVSTVRSNAASDCVAHTDKETMEAIIQGRVNAMAALLRGAIKIEGQALLLALFRSLLTAPAAETESKRVGKMSGRRS
jgi:putative sterol carrier protein